MIESSLITIVIQKVEGTSRKDKRIYYQKYWANRLFPISCSLFPVISIS
ncbi:MAG: hypothetical protein AAGJ08_15665 [Cyanobacteria bacterium P01_H01_bin.35]